MVIWVNVALASCGVLFLIVALCRSLAEQPARVEKSRSFFLISLVLSLVIGAFALVEILRKQEDFIAISLSFSLFFATLSVLFSTLVPKCDLHPVKVDKLAEGPSKEPEQEASVKKIIHDMNNSVSVVLGMAESLNEFGAESPEDLKDVSRTILESSKKLVNQVRSLRSIVLEK